MEKKEVHSAPWEKWHAAVEEVEVEEVGVEEEQAMVLERKVRLHASRQMMGEMMHEKEEVNHVILMQEKWQAVEEKVYSSGQ